MSSSYFLFLNSTNSGIVSLIPVAVVIFSFWLVVKKKREKESKGKQKDDAWYIVKDYLKLTNRQGYQVYDLTLYPRAEKISSLRDYILASKQALERENARLLNKKIEKPPLKQRILTKFSGKKQLIFPKEEEYHRNIELQTLKVLAEKYSYFQNYFQEYNNWSETPKFKHLIQNKLIGETLSKLSKNKKLAARNRYLVCFKTVNREGHISDWESIEIELFRNPKKGRKAGYKILFTASIDFKKELHWIYSLQLRHFKDKKDAQKHAEKMQKSRKTREKIGKIIAKILLLDYLIPLFQKRIKKTKK